MVAEGVRNKGRHKVSRPQEQVRRIDAKDARIRELNQARLDGQRLRHALAQVLVQVVAVGDAKEQGRDQNGHGGAERLHEEGQHARTEGELLGQRGHQVIPDPGQVTQIIFPAYK